MMESPSAMSLALHSKTSNILAVAEKKQKAKASLGAIRLHNVHFLPRATADATRFVTSRLRSSFKSSIE